MAKRWNRSLDRPFLAVLVRPKRLLLVHLRISSWQASSWVTRRRLLLLLRSTRSGWRLLSKVRRVGVGGFPGCQRKCIAVKKSRNSYTNFGGSCSWIYRPQYRNQKNEDVPPKLIRQILGFTDCYAFFLTIGSGWMRGRLICRDWSTRSEFRPFRLISEESDMITWDLRPVSPPFKDNRGQWNNRLSNKKGSANPGSSQGFSHRYQFFGL